MSEKRGNLYSYDPIEDIQIIGGKMLADDERGDLDTDVDIEHPLYDERLQVDLDDPYIANIDAYGVMTPVLVKKIDGVVVLVAGRRRVRAARKVNRMRKKRGEPAMRVEAKLLLTTGDNKLMGAMIVENEARVGDDYPTKMRKMIAYHERGVGIEDIAITFAIPLATAKEWMKFEERAAPELKNAVEAGTMSIGAGLELMRAGSHDEQREALADMGPDTNVRAARDASKKAKAKKTGATVVVGISDMRTQRKVLQAVVDMPHPNAGKETLAFWSGVEAAFKAIVGEKDADKRVLEMVDRVRSAMKASK